MCLLSHEVIIKLEKSSFNPTSTVDRRIEKQLLSPFLLLTILSATTIVRDFITSNFSKILI